MDVTTPDKISLDVTAENIEGAFGSSQVHPWFGDIPVAEEERLFVKLTVPEKDSDTNAGNNDIVRKMATELIRRQSLATEDSANLESEERRKSRKNDGKAGSVEKFVNCIVRSDIGFNFKKFTEGLANNCVHTTSGLKWYQVGNRMIIIIKNSKRIDEMEFDQNRLS